MAITKSRGKKNKGGNKKTENQLPRMSGYPFRGGKARIEKDMKMCAVQCTEKGCEANVMFTGKEYASRDLAAAWNERATETHKGNTYIRDFNADKKPPAELGACPFCGNTKLNYRVVYGKSCIERADCGADVGFYKAISEADVCGRWNRRV